MALPRLDRIIDFIKKASLWPQHNQLLAELKELANQPDGQTARPTIRLDDQVQRILHAFISQKLSQPLSLV